MRTLPPTDARFVLVVQDVRTGRETYRHRNESLRYVCHVLGTDGPSLRRTIAEQGTYAKIADGRLYTVFLPRRVRPNPRWSAFQKVWRTSPDLRKAVCQHRNTTDSLVERDQLRRNIDTHAESDKVAIVYGGIDCDGTRSDDRHVVIPANVMAVVRWTDQYHEGAEGPQWTRLCRPSVAAMLSPTTRDLALEAHENGHPHVLRY